MDKYANKVNLIDQEQTIVPSIWCFSQLDFDFPLHFILKSCDNLNLTKNFITNMDLATIENYSMILQAKSKKQENLIGNNPDSFQKPENETQTTSSGQALIPLKDSFYRTINKWVTKGEMEMKKESPDKTVISNCQRNLNRFKKENSIYAVDPELRARLNNIGIKSIVENVEEATSE